jgi:hypothetical protein
MHSMHPKWKGEEDRVRRSRLLKERLQLVGGPRNYRATAPYDYRPLHQLRVAQQEIDHRLFRDVVARLEPEFIEALVLPDHLGNGDVKHRENPLEGVPRRGSFQVFDSVELDTAPFQDFKGGARMASAGIMIERHFTHGWRPSISV